MSKLFKSQKVKMVFTKWLLVPFAFLLISFLGASCCLFLQDYKLDYLSYRIVNYNKVLGNSNYVSPIMTVTRNDTSNNNSKTYDDLFSIFHYSLLDNGARVTVDSKTSIVMNDTFEYDLKLTTQPAFSINKANINSNPNDEPIYSIDYGQYYSYFTEIVPRHRGDNKTSFMYISDTLADKIIEDFHIPGETKLEKYENLIINEEFCFQKLLIDGTKEVPIAINNILHTNYETGQSQRMQRLYGDFCLIWLDRINDLLNISFEIDLKTNPYGNKKIVQNMQSLGYNHSNSYFCIRTFDGTEYKVNNSLSAQLMSALKTANNPATYLPFIFIQIISLGFFIILNHFKQLNYSFKTVSGIMALMFIVYGIIVTFSYNYPLFSVSPILFIIFWLGLYFWKKITERNLICKGSQSEWYYEVRI